MQYEGTRPARRVGEGRSIIGTLGLRPSHSRWNAASHTSSSAHRSARYAAGLLRLGVWLLPAALVLCALSLQAGGSASGAGTVTVTSPDGLNLRSQPNTQAQVLAVVPSGSVLTVTGDPTADMWYPVTFGSVSGWAYGAYLTSGSVSPQNALAATPLSAAAPPPQPASSASSSTARANSSGSATSDSVANSSANTASGSSIPSMIVSTDALNLRAGPSATAPVETALPQGTQVQVVGPATGGIWDPVVVNGLSGWVDLAYLAPAGSNSAQANSLPASSLLTNADLSNLTAATFGNPVLGKPAGPESGLPVASVPASAKGKFLWPVAGRRISTIFQSAHQAIDIDQYPQGGNPAQATADGIVSYAGGSACCSYGLYVILQHKDGFSSLYAHLSKIDVSQGQIVRQGQQIGVTGNTGFSTGPHIHFAIYENGDPLDPLTVLAPGAQIEAGADCYLC